MAICGETRGILGVEVGTHSEEVGTTLGVGDQAVGAGVANSTQAGTLGDGVRRGASIHLLTILGIIHGVSIVSMTRGVMAEVGEIPTFTTMVRM